MECLTVSVKDTAQLLGVSEATVRNYQKEGWLKPISGLPGKFRKKDVLDMIGVTEQETRPAELRKLRAERDHYKDECSRLLGILRSLTADANAACVKEGI